MRGSGVPNFINREEMLAFVNAVFIGVSHRRLRARLSALAIDYLQNDERNARRARTADLSGRDDWACELFASGERCDMFVPHPANRMRLERIAAAAAQVARILIQPPAATPNSSERTARLAVENLAAKIDHMSFEAAEKKCAEAARLVQEAIARRDGEAANTIEHFAPARISAGESAYWRLVTSVAQLHEAGEQLKNCWRRERSLSAQYASMLIGQLSQFWTHHEKEGALATAGLLFDTHLNTIVEVRGVANEEVNPRDAGLKAFMRTKNCGISLLTFNLPRQVDADTLDQIIDILERRGRRPETEEE